MIDFHNHILPGCDDGASTLEESLEMLQLASNQGITEVVNTIHFQHPKMEGKNVDFYYLSDQIKSLQSKLDKRNINIKLHLTSEVFYLPNLCTIKDNPLTTIGNGKYMLIEFTTHIFPEGYDKQFYDLQLNGITPIIAHPERYRFVQENPDVLEQWIEKGYIIQLDAGSVLGHFGIKIKKLSTKFLNNSLIHLIGSDAHNNSKRNFCLKDAYSHIKNKVSNTAVDTLKDNASKLLLGEQLILPKNNNNSKTILQRISSFFK